MSATCLCICAASAGLTAVDGSIVTMCDEELLHAPAARPVLVLSSGLRMATYSSQQRRPSTPPSHQRQHCLRSWRPCGQPSRPTTFLQRTALKQVFWPSLNHLPVWDLADSRHVLSWTEDGIARDDW